MSLNLSHPSQKQTVLAIVGVVVAVVLLVLLGNMYGRFVKTQVAVPAATYSATGDLKAGTLGIGTHTLKATVRNASGSVVVASRNFEVTPALTPTSVPNPYDPTNTLLCLAIYIEGQPFDYDISDNYHNLEIYNKSSRIVVSRGNRQGNRYCIDRNDTLDNLKSFVRVITSDSNGEDYDGYLRDAQEQSDGTYRIDLIGAGRGIPLH